MITLKLFLISAIFVYVVSGERCPGELTQDCTCSLRRSQWHITCSGYDLVNITRYLPPNTAVFRYNAMEEFVNLGDVDFSRLTELTAFQIKDPGDYKILDRKIAPMTREPKLFSGLSKLQELRINVNWKMPELPNLLDGLDNLQLLDFSNTRWMDIDNLITSLQGLRNNTNMKVLNLWNMKTLQHSSSNLHLDLEKLLGPLSQSRLEELNIGYNALRSVGIGLIQYAPWLKRLIVRNNVLVPIVTCSLMTEVMLHKSLVEADFSEQGYRPTSDSPLELRIHSEHTNQNMLRPEKFHNAMNGTLYYDKYPTPATIKTQGESSVHSHPSFLSLEQFLSVVHGTILHPRDAPPANGMILQAEARHKLTPSVHNILKKYLTCFIMLYNDTCSIFTGECSDIKELLVEDHSLLCDLLNFFFMWHFTGVHCNYIPPFKDMISRDCGACLVAPTMGNLRKLDLSNLNVYDLVLQYGSYRNRPTCFHPNTSAEYVDLTGFAVHGYAEVNRFFAGDTKGLENLKVFNCSQNFLTVFFPNIGSNFPWLEVLNASHNLIEIADDRKFVNLIKFIQVLDLSHNRIQDLGVDSFVQLDHLRHLDLSYNLVKEFNVSLSSSKRLEYLDLSNNILSSLPQYTIDELNEIALSNTSHVIHVDIGSNGLSCTCATKNFVQWVVATHPPNIVVVNSGKYFCTNRYSYNVALHSVKISELNFECYENVIYGCAGACCVVIIALFCLAYKRRFLLRHKWYTLTKKATGKAYSQRHHKYHAFICYDEADSDWIDFEAKKNLKELQIAYGEENIEIGQRTNEGVCQLIDDSRRCIIVLSPDFVCSRVNMFHTLGVEEKLMSTGNDIVIIIKLRPLKKVGIDKTLKELLERRKCLEWKEDIPDAQNFFWEKLTDILQKPCEELYDARSDRASRPTRHTVHQNEENAHHDDPRDEENAHHDDSRDEENALHDDSRDEENALHDDPRDEENAPLVNIQ